MTSFLNEFNTLLNTPHTFFYTQEHHNPKRRSLYTKIMKLQGGRRHWTFNYENDTLHNGYFRSLSLGVYIYLLTIVLSPIIPDRYIKKLQTTKLFKILNV